MNKKKRGSQKDDKNDPRYKFMMDLEEAKKCLVGGFPEDAIKIARKAMIDYKSKKDENQMIILPAYFILAEAYISDKNTSEDKEVRLKQAENFLFGALMAYTKHKDNIRDEGQSEITEEEVDRLKATLDKTFAKLCLAQNDLNKALDHLTKGIYQDSKRFGPESPQVAMSYYQMGSIFQAKQNKPLEVKAFYDKTVDIWFKHLLRYLSIQMEQGEDLLIEDLDIEQTLVKEAADVVDKIKIHFEQMSFDDQNQFEQTMTMINYTLGILYKLLDEGDMAIEALTQVAQKQVEYGDHLEVERIEKLIQIIRESQ